jgi:hypothetical protein
VLGLRLPAAAIVGSALLVGALPDVAVSAALTPRLYWTESGGGSIGEASLDGTSANQSFITGASGPIQVAVDNQ